MSTSLLIKTKKDKAEKSIDAGVGRGYAAGATSQWWIPLMFIAALLVFGFMVAGFGLAVYNYTRTCTGNCTTACIPPGNGSNYTLVPFNCTNSSLAMNATLNTGNGTCINGTSVPVNCTCNCTLNVTCNEVEGPPGPQGANGTNTTCYINPANTTFPISACVYAYSAQLQGVSSTTASNNTWISITYEFTSILAGWAQTNLSDFQCLTTGNYSLQLKAVAGSTMVGYNFTTVWVAAMILRAGGGGSWAVIPGTTSGITLAGMDYSSGPEPCPPNPNAVSYGAIETVPTVVQFSEDDVIRFYWAYSANDASNVPYLGSPVTLNNLVFNDGTLVTPPGWPNITSSAIAIEEIL